MEFTKELLGLHPWEALIEMINRHYTKALDPAYVTLVTIDQLTDEKIFITLALHPSTSLHNQLPPEELLSVVVTRLDLQRFFKGPVSMVFTRRPVTTLDITRRILDQTGIVFDKDDVVNEVVPTGATNYLLKAHPRSMRWIGQLSITLLD